LNTSNFHIYNASAGSGKTFTLVKEYLKILLKSNNKEQFKHILAITFTNKAVAEMKERIIETLKQFSSKSIIENPNSMSTIISNELEIEPDVLHEKSKLILNTIIYNYAAFDVSTIDGFTHKLIRTFAHDLKLPLNFEVELDQENLLNEAVDQLISKAGIDKTLTKILIDFAIEKADDDKSWDVSYDFNLIAKLLINENDIPFIKTLKGKTFNDFKNLKTNLRKQIVTNESEIIKIADEALTLIKECGLQFDDFSSSYLPKYFQKLASKNLSVGYNTKWQTDLIENNSLYPKRVTNEIASIINEIQPQIAKAFIDTKDLVFQLKFLKAFYKNITSLSVLNAINSELKKLKDEQNKMLISEFNTIISKEIINQPTPFIYERLGEKFRHYFIDEFQDTSELQWQNLIPLIDNTLSGENLKQEQGTAMLVGDAKQAIYRWRGGKAEQFINLFNKVTLPFQVEQNVETLPTNFRSFKEIITFNNSFFNYLSQLIFSNETYSNLYKEGSVQNTFIEQNGYVNISFLDINKDDNRDEIYPEKVLETINSCICNGYQLNDICILVRKKKEGVAIAEFLSEHGKQIMSSETMLIYNAPEVKFIDAFLKLLIQPDDSETKVIVLNYLALKFNIEDKHHFLTKHIKLPIAQLFKSFEEFSISLNHNQLLHLPLYDLAETIVRSFKLVETSNAYVQFFLDFVLDYTQKQGSGLSGFLEAFEKKKESLSIVSPEGQNTVQIMTIHKSKGLEFPIVIFPYADLDIYREKDPKEWFPLDSEKYNDFSHALINYNKDFENYSETGNDIHIKHRSQLELDNINLLYVALTRPIEHLYIITKVDVNSKGVINPNTYSGLFMQYLSCQQLYSDTQNTYDFGTPKKILDKKNEITQTIKHQEFISTAKENHNIKIVTNAGYLWDTSQKEAIEKGNLIHNIMSHIKTENDIDFVITDFISSGTINSVQANNLKHTLKQIVEHPDLKEYYNSELTIYNERDIISIDGSILRPDRLVINSKNEASIIDYKTGLQNTKYKEQLQDYQDILEEMDFQVTHKILIYINNDIKIESL